MLSDINGICVKLHFIGSLNNYITFIAKQIVRKSILKLNINLTVVIEEPLYALKIST